MVALPTPPLLKAMAPFLPVYRATGWFSGSAAVPVTGAVVLLPDPETFFSPRGQQIWSNRAWKASATAQRFAVIFVSLNLPV